MKGLTVFIILTIVVFSVFLSGLFHTSKVELDTKKNFIIVTPSIQITPQKTLQMQTFALTTVIPTPTSAPIPTTPPGGWCAPDIPLEHGESCNCFTREIPGIICKSEIICKDSKVYHPGTEATPCFIMSTPPTDDLYDRYKDDTSCIATCFAKPVIYLYPTKTTLVDVKLDIPGEITKSDPLYPNGGWRSVEAHPDGTLIYNNKTYRELYYESQVNKKLTPQDGIIIKSEKIEENLRTITTKLGLLPKEQQEFLDYWMPRLKKLNSPYIFFSILSQEQKESVDHVSIEPKPDTRIEFLAYFKPIYSLIKVKPLILPETPPKREGFTEVEWGGTIDY